MTDLTFEEWCEFMTGPDWTEEVLALLHEGDLKAALEVHRKNAIA